MKDSFQIHILVRILLLIGKFGAILRLQQFCIDLKINLYPMFETTNWEKVKIPEEFKMNEVHSSGIRS